MTAVLEGNLDYILFVYGLGFVLLAITLLGLRTTVTSPLPWKWLGISALFLGLSAWTDMFTVAFGHQAGVAALRTVLFVVGCAFLVEFARTCWIAVGGARVGRWIVVALVLLAALGGFAGVRGLDATAGYFLGLPGGLWAAAGLWRYQRAGGKHGRPLLLAAAAMALFVAAECVVTLKAPLPPATWVNQEAFLSAFGFPVQFLCMAFAVPFVVGLGLHYRALLREEHPGLVDRRGTLYEVAMLAALAVILLAGLYATSLVGDRWDAGARADLLGRAALAAAAINPDRVASQTATPADVGTVDYERLREQLTFMEGVSKDVRWFYLMALDGGDIVFSVDGIPLDDPGHAEPGTMYQEPPPGLVEVFASGGDMTIGPYTDEYGTFVSAFAPIRDPADGSVVSVLGLDIDAADWVHSLARARATPILVTLLLCLIVIAAYVAQERLRLAALSIWESAKDYRTVLETMQDGFYRADENGDLLMVSPSFARMFGFLTTAQVVGRNLARDLYQHPEDRDAFLAALAAGDGEVADYEVMYRRADGRPICVSTNSHYSRDAAGKVCGVEGVLRDITERKRAEEELRFTRFVVEQGGDIVFWTTADGVFKYANRMARETLGYSLDELRTMMITDIDPDIPQGWPARMRELELAGSITFETRHRTRDGTIIPMEITAMYREYNGDAYNVAFARDITSRKRAEAALRESRERLDFVLRSAEVGAWDWDIPAGVATWDDTIVALYGMAPGVLEGPWQSFDPSVHPDDLETLETAIDRCLETGAPYEAEFRVLRADGAVAYVAERGRVTYDAAGEPVRMSGVTWDITRRRATEESLRETTAYLQNLLDYANAPIIVWDPQFRITRFNHAFELLTGLTAGDAIGKSLEILFPPASSEASMRHIRETVGGERWEVVEIGILHVDGSERTVLWNSATVFESDSRTPVATIAQGQDITERKRAEDSLHRAKEQMEAANWELAVAARRANQLALEAESASSAKSEFLANMSHEIRTPMNGVIGMTELLLDTDLDWEQRDYALTVQNSAEALLTIINDILDFSKIEAGKLEMETLDFDLRSAVEDTCDLPALHAQGKGLELTALVEADVPSALRGDPGRLRQVLTNIIGNAIKFTDSGEVAVSVALVEEAETAATLRFEVRDTGIGIPAEKLDMLFESFTQADASTTRRFGGTGLGLTISRRLVQLMGGEIGVQSVPGVGSTFWFTAGFAKQDPAALAAADERLEPIDIAGVRILAVDDNATNRRVIAGMLEAWRCRHTEVDGAGPALDALRAACAEGDPYRIVILDMMMPDTDGETLGVAIKSDPALADSELIMMTSMGSRGDAGRLETLGFAAYLTKPVKQSQVFDCLMVVLNRRERPDPQVTPRIITRHALAERDKRRMRILLAEDNPINQRVALKTLEKLGYQAEAVSNGAEALEALASRRYDLVLMDVQMPEMDGMEATRRIRDPRSAVRDHSVPIVALTAHAMKEDRDACLAAGMNDYLPKPVKPDELTAVLAHWTGRRAGPEPAVGLTRGAPAVEGAPAAAAQAEVAATDAGEPPVFDEAVLLSLLRGDREAAAEITAEFLKDAPLQVAALQDALAAGDAALARRQAHTLKGASANVGAEALRAVAYSAELACADGSLQGVAELAERLDAELRRLQRKLAEDGGAS